MKNTYVSTKNTKAKRILKHTNPSEIVVTNDPLINWAVNCINAGKSERETLVPKASTEASQIKLTEGMETSLNASLRSLDALEVVHPTESNVFGSTENGNLTLSNIGAFNLSDEELELPEDWEDDPSHFRSIPDSRELLKRSLVAAQVHVNGEPIESKMNIQEGALAKPPHFSILDGRRTG